MNIFYCCGVLEPQKKIWWKNFLQKEGDVVISKKFNSAVTHVVCGRESTTFAEVLKATKCENMAHVKIVQMSWLIACMKAKQRVAEDGHLIPEVPEGNVSTVGVLNSSPSTSKRLRKDNVDEVRNSPSPEAETRRLKHQKRDAGADTDATSSAPSLRPPCATLKIGSLIVAAYGVGSLAWGVTYPDPAARPCRGEVLELIRAAVEASAPHRVLIDTADSYCENMHDFGYMETILGEAMQSSSVMDACSAGNMQPPLIVTKGGMKRIGSESNSWREASYHTPEAWEACIRASLRRLRCDAEHPLALWQVHHCSSKHLAAVMTALQKLVAENLIVHVGLCNVSIADIEFCQQYLPIASIQNTYSLWDRTAERPFLSGRSSSTSKRGVLLYCSENSIPFLAYGVLGGLAARRGENRWQEYPELLSLAAKKGIHVATLVLAMIRHRFPCLLPLVGSRQRRHVEALRAASEVRLTLTELEVFPSLD